MYTMETVIMQNILYNRQHLREYLKFGLLAAIAFIIPVLLFFFFMDYNQVWILYSGSFLFIFVILWYVIILSNRRPEYKSTWMMIIASHLAVLTGIIFSVIFSLILCFIFIPDFLSGKSPNVLTDAPVGLNKNNWSLLMLLFLCATIENFGAGGFIGILGPYVFKKNQTADKTAALEKDLTMTENKKGRLANRPNE